MQKNAIAEEFLSKYCELENAIKKKYHIDFGTDDGPVYVLQKKKEFSDCSDEIKLCRYTRNILCHNPKIDGEYPVCPSRGMINVLDMLIRRLSTPPKVDSVMVKYQNVLSATPNDSVRPIIKEMSEKTYTHIPIVKDRCVVGVFSENTLLSLFSDDDIAIIDDTTTFNDESIRKAIPLEKHIAECFRFVSRNATVFEVKELFRKAVENQERIGLVFVTQNGRQNERLLGIISSWDIPRIVD